MVRLTHYLDETTMAYTGCFQLIDNSIVKLEITNDVDLVTCPDCVDAILAEWEAE
jgi:hypothetical protein